MSKKNFMTLRAFFGCQITIYWRLEKMTRGHNIVTDGWAGASNPHPHHNHNPHPTYSNATTTEAAKMHVFAILNLSVTDGPTDGLMDRRMDRWTNRQTTSLMELRVFLTLNLCLRACFYSWQSHFERATRSLATFVHSHRSLRSLAPQRYAHSVHGLAHSLRSLPRGTVEIHESVFMLKSRFMGTIEILVVSRNTP